MQVQKSITVTIPNPTAGQLLALSDILGATDEVAAAKSGRKSKPAKTVSKDEEENFGEDAISEEELEEGEEEESEEESEEEETELTFDDVKDVINEYGEKHAAQMKAILLSFGCKNTKELSTKKSKWQPVLDKVNAKLKALKKKK